MEIIYGDYVKDSALIVVFSMDFLHQSSRTKKRENPFLSNKLRIVMMNIN